MELARIGKRKRPLRRLHPSTFTGGSSLCTIGGTATRHMYGWIDGCSALRLKAGGWRLAATAVEAHLAARTLALFAVTTVTRRALECAAYIRPACKRDDATAMGESATADVEPPHGASQPEPRLPLTCPLVHRFFMRRVRGVCRSVFPFVPLLAASLTAPRLQVRAGC